MAKLKNPAPFSSYFGIDPAILKNLGVLDPTLNVDTNLFIDPLLLSKSGHPEMAEGAAKRYDEHFATIISLLSRTRIRGDVAWKAARRKLQFREIKGTCLGYGANSIRGSGFGQQLTDQVLGTAKEVIDLGVDDPALFSALALFEAGIGPDRISDMTTHVIFADLLLFNRRILEALDLETEAFSFNLPTSGVHSEQLPLNPFEEEKTPVILVPRDVLRDLPIANDLREVSEAAQHNIELRERVNAQIGEIWKVKTKEDKEELRARVLNNRNAFETLLDLIHRANGLPYDFESDPRGEVFWRQLADVISNVAPLALQKPRRYDVEAVREVVDKIVEQFKFLIEQRDLYRELYDGAGKKRPEKSAQRLFFAVAFSYCKANDLDITPEADTGNGPVDFKVSGGYVARVVVEVKLSTGRVVHGFEKQLPTYAAAEESSSAIYLLIDVGKMGRKYEDLLALKREATLRGEKTPDVVVVDGQKRPSASVT